MHHAISQLLAQTVVTTNDNATMGFITWIVVGLIAGFLGSKIVNKHGDGIIIDIILGLIGAVVGGFLIHLVGIQSGGFIFSIIVATIGAILVLIIYHKLIRKTPA